MKKVLSIIMCFVLILGMIGCSPKENSNDSINADNDVSSNTDVDTSISTPTSTPEVDKFEPTDKTISVSWFTPWWMDSSDYDYIFDEFSRKYPEYTIVRNDVEDLPTLMAAIQAGTQPDVFMGGDPNTTDFTSGCYQELFMNMDTYLNEDLDVNLTNLDPTQMKLTTFINGSHYAVPYLTSQFCLIYNKTLFAKAGLDPNSPPTTWTEYYDYAKKLTKFDQNGVVTQMGIIDGPWPYQLYNLKKTNGYLSDNGIDSVLNSPWVQEVHEYCDKFSKIVGSTNSMPKDVSFSIQNGNAAMTANGNLNLLNEYAQAGIDFGIAPMPHPDDFDESVLPSLLWYYFSIPNGAKNPNGGWLFAKFALTEGIYQTVANDYQKNPSGVFPQFIAHTPTREKVYSTFLNEISDDSKALIEERDKFAQGEIYVMPSSPISSIMNNIQQKWFVKADIGLKEKLSGAHNEYQSSLETWEKEMTSRGWVFEEGKPAVLPSTYK